MAFGSAICRAKRPIPNAGVEGATTKGSIFETTLAGSLPKPAWLAEPAWRHEGEALARAKQDATLVWLKEQERAGIDIVSDGEQFRIHFSHGLWPSPLRASGAAAGSAGLRQQGRRRKLEQLDCGGRRSKTVGPG
jgi:hypothetical protein